MGSVVYRLRRGG